MDTLRCHFIRLLALIAWALPCLMECGCSHTINAENLATLRSGKNFNRAGTYNIGPGDVIFLKVFGEETLSGNYTISPTGVLSVPLIAPMNVMGLAPHQLEEKLKSALTRVIKSPEVSVTVTDIRSLTVFFGGEVTKVGSLNLSNKTTVLQGILLAGGLTRFANERIVIIRRVDELKTRRYETTWGAILEGADNLDNITLESGDIVIAE